MYIICIERDGRTLDLDIIQIPNIYLGNGKFQNQSISVFNFATLR